MVRMLLTVVAVVVAVKIILNLLQPRKQDSNIQGQPQRPVSNARRSDDIEDAEFREIK